MRGTTIVTLFNSIAPLATQNESARPRTAPLRALEIILYSGPQAGSRSKTETEVLLLVHGLKNEELENHSVTK